MAAQLPKDFEPLPQAAGVGRHRATRQPYDLTLRVAELAGIERGQARKATEAVLETFAVRISAGEVEDLRKEIPSNLRHALDRGLRERRDAVPMNLDEFLDHIAAREGINRDDAPTTPAPCSPRCEMITQQGVPRHGGPAAGRIRAAVGRDRFGRLTQHGVTSVPPGLLAGRDAG